MKQVIRDGGGEGEKKQEGKHHSAPPDRQDHIFLFSLISPSTIRLNQIAEMPVYDYAVSDDCYSSSGNEALYYIVCVCFFIYKMAPS